MKTQWKTRSAWEYYLNQRKQNRTTKPTSEDDELVSLLLRGKEVADENGGD